MGLSNAVLLASLLFYICQWTAAYQPSCKNNIVYYYGQHHSEGGESISLYDYCDKDYADEFIISSVVASSDADGMPMLDLKEGIDGAKSYSGSDMKYYPSLSDGIKHCQTMGKKVFISVNTDSTPVGIEQAERFARQVWQLFGPNVTAGHRPFGTAVVDGFTLSVESSDHLRRRHISDSLRLAQTLRSEFDSDQYRHYLLSASLPCQFLKTELPIIKTLQATFFDIAFIKDYDQACPFTLQQWDDFLGRSHNGHIMMLPGVSSNPSSKGYMDPHTVAEKLKTSHKLGHLAGVMVSDASAAFGGSSNFAKELRYEIGSECHPSTYGKPADTSKEPLDRNLFVSITNQFNRLVFPFKKRDVDAPVGGDYQTPTSDKPCECETDSPSSTISTSHVVPTPTDGIFCLPNGLQLCPTGVPLSERGSYWECEGARWIKRPCGEGTVCQQLSWDHIVCGFNYTPPVSSPTITPTSVTSSISIPSQSCPFPNTTTSFTDSSLTETTTVVNPTPTEPTTSTGTITFVSPSPTPSEGESCPHDGLQVCPANVHAATGYWECVHGSWLYRLCEIGTSCKQEKPGEIICVSRQSSTPPFTFESTETAGITSLPSTTSNAITPTSSVSISPVCPLPTANLTEGGPCSTVGNQACPVNLPVEERTSYWECVNSQWLYRPCAPGTVCSQRYCDRIICDFADNALP